MTISPIPPINLTSVQEAGAVARTATPVSAAKEPLSFEQVLSALDQSQQNADTLVEKLSLGENVDLHQVMIGLEENDVNFRVALAIRDRLVEAYREIMRMQI
ncbi:MAG TPA: flagellar hook-basal body complex protein FliE [Anaerolinea thermolimosa]|mgnify:CR=1 FL=1|uniref:Flagellar hook-basal body complex protein FliE n=1 Tax=Anaerolinea thermolimosa TaxID=229919 RepID=A0A3D1JHN8_9CHLR|nr:flagellar hook-basal body complex protein FliE [Anaerolinea thermolimosa]GAP07874.1 flagellar hook-basal body complex protein FliE [Anaerolinea thermolimosa]HCE18003.1 flagellar hook-basal body complex protein FliE [Anaerolinea thermolimosa]